MYDSPIRLIASGIQETVEDNIYKAVQRYGIDVDKDELMKALNYDRGQYDKGFADGVLHGERLYAPKIGEWIERVGYVICSKCGYKYIVSSNFCPNCGAKMKGENDNV